MCCSPRATKDAVATKCFGGFSIISILKIGVYGKWAHSAEKFATPPRTPLLLRLDRPLGGSFRFPARLVGYNSYDAGAQHVLDRALLRSAIEQRGH